MESQKPKVAMYVKRSFGDKLNASFDFIKENWKILLKFTTYLLLPVSLIQALSLNGLMGGAFAMTAMSKTATVSICIIFMGDMPLDACGRQQLPEFRSKIMLFSLIRNICLMGSRVQKS